MIGFLRFDKFRRAIKNPRLGVLDLTAGTSAAIVHEDISALQDFFTSVERSNDRVPKCDVLFLYATLGDGGLLEGTERYLRATSAMQEPELL